ncbi:MAG: hypothetical protein KBF81_10255 [Aquabacterium sp.]|nr:hypothetical protein [Aquabacterium sp.]
MVPRRLGQAPRVARGAPATVFAANWSYSSEVNFFPDEAAAFKCKPLLKGGLRGGYSWITGKYKASD